MQILVHAKGFSCTPAIRLFIERKLTQSIYRYRSEISQVSVYLDDLNSSEKGGEDMHVLIQVLLHRSPAAVVEAVSSDLYHSIAIAAVRSRKAIKRELRRQLQLERGQSRKMRSSLSGRFRAEFA